MHLRTMVLPLALGFALTAGTASAGQFGVQGFGGVGIPIAQDDNDKSSATFGARFPVSGSSIFSLEPYVYGISGSETEATFGGLPYTREGFKVTTAGANVTLGRLLGRGFRIYPFVGVNSNTLQRDDDEITKIGFNGGLGFGFRPGNLLIDLRGELNMVDVGKTSRKWAAATLGLGFRLKSND